MICAFPSPVLAHLDGIYRSLCRAISCFAVCLNSSSFLGDTSTMIQLSVDDHRLSVVCNANLQSSLKAWVSLLH